MAPTQTLDQIRDLEAQFASAMTQLYAVGNGLARVRQNLDVAGPDAAATPTRVTTAPIASPVPAGPAQPDPAAQRTPRWWERPGMVAKVLGAIGAVVTLIGIAFLLAIAIAAGIFGPGPRTVAGALLAGALFAAGVVVRRRSSESRASTISGGEALVATGLAAAYLDLLAATAVYDFIPAPPGLVLAGLLSAGAFVLARRWDSELLGILAAAPPMVLAPMVGGLESLSTYAFVAILLVASALAHHGHEWPWLYAARVAPGALILVSFAAGWQGERATVITLLTATAIGMVLAGVSEQSRRLAHLPLYATLAAALPLAVAVANLTVDRLVVAASLSGLFLALAALVRSLTGRVFVSAWVWVGPLVIGTVLVIVAAFALPTAPVAGTVLAVASGAYLLLSAWRRSRPIAAMGALLGVVSAVQFLPATAATVSAGTMRAVLDPMMVLHGIALTALAVLAHVTVSAVRGDAALQSVTTRLACAGAFVTGSVTVIVLGTWLGSLTGATVTGFYGGHAVATAMWTAIAALLMTTVGSRVSDRGLMVRIGLVLVAVAVGKLFLFDLSALSGLFRVVAFVVTGVIVLALGAAVAREPGRRRPQPTS